MAGIVYLPGSTTARKLINDVRAVEDALRDTARFHGAIENKQDQIDWGRRIQEVSAGKNAVIFVGPGWPSIYVHTKGETLKEVGLHPTDEHLHPAFNINGVAVPQMYIGKYEACVHEGYALSLRGLDPRTGVNFNTAAQFCRNNGPGHHLMTNAEWAFILAQCKHNGYWPRGNTYYGRHHTELDERGEPTHWHTEDARTGRIATGSGPRESAAWGHAGMVVDIHDMVGNIMEWVSGWRLMDGEIQVIPDNDAAADNADLSATSPLWKAIMPDGVLVAPGTEGTLKLDNTTPGDSTQTAHNVGGAPRINTAVVNPAYIPGGQVDYGYSQTAFKNITAADGVSIPDILKYLGIYPLDAAYQGDYVWVRNYGERVPFRGGAFSNGASAGLAAVPLRHSRAHTGPYLGFRPAFVPVSGL